MGFLKKLNGFVLRKKSNRGKKVTRSNASVGSQKSASSHKSAMAKQEKLASQDSARQEKQATAVVSTALSSSSKTFQMRSNEFEEAPSLH